MHLGGLESTQKARVALGCAWSNSYASLITGRRLLLNLLLAQNRGIRLATLLLLLKKNCIVEISIILSELELHENFLFV